MSRLSGPLLIAIAVLVPLAAVTGARWPTLAASAGLLIFLALAVGKVSWSRQIFVATAAGLALVALASRAEWPAMIERALATAVFVAAFFTALGWLRSAAGFSPAIERCGRFLASQPPGRRYLTLTLGGHLFGLVLTYGAISLLGSLATASAAREARDDIRRIRTRRMLLAIQRGFISTLSWSPLTFSLAITTSIIEGASWAGVLGYGAVTAVLLAGLGWLMDTIVKPKLSGPRPDPRPPEGSWARLGPLLLLLAILVVGIGGLHLASGLRAVIAVMFVVPLVSLAWMALQGRGHGRPPLVHGAERARHYVAEELPSYTPELVLLAMAGFIGTLGGALLSPLFAASGIDLAALPAPLLLALLVWVAPITGQLGMNPILSISLIAPLIPEASTLGVSPNLIVAAITAGWALSGASSPVTATTLLIGKLAGVSALKVGAGLSWNGPYTLIAGAVLTGWILMLAQFT